ncbi:PE family protein [Mycobacterium florentinum]|uniref:PE family protein n=1 Tax=Mycobacterium florentinum TaxID=292462 RepID=A0A1X1TUH7_MYCFL|nr:PE family protein [Mycobacterium florentinum]MCV7408957.1 PE family protein [Mycobacterium florentinum]ORV48240.1 PE family protein [Mycobacterium florentinum]BBX77751.1 PE family protein [Mycobacterium florentinum]
MSFLTVHPEALAVAAAQLGAVGGAMNAQNAAAAGVTGAVVPAAADEVSALVAAQFMMLAQMYRSVSAQAAEVHETLVKTMAESADSYAVAEAVNAAATGRGA